MPGHTTRLSLPYPLTNNSEAPTGPAQIFSLATALDNVVPYGQGILANRGVSTGGSPGIQGRLYYVIGDSTPANNGILWLDEGTGWVQAGSAPTIVDVLANRPLASAVLLGLRFLATDQVSEWIATSAPAWLRIGSLAGDLIQTLNATAQTGRVLATGQNVSRVGIYADLFALWNTTYGVGDGSTTFGLPDLRGRMLVTLGTHADVATIGSNDGVAVANRRPAHNHTVNVNESLNSSSGTPQTSIDPTAATTNAAPAGVTVGPGGTAPVDAPAYIVTNVEVKL